MISPNFGSDCMKARLYYYDYLNRQAGRKVPKSTFEHISRCQFCQDEINRLDSLLMHANRDIEQSLRNLSITEIIGFHLAYADKPVSCSTVKPFLPSLVIPGLEIKVQTPITAHIDGCPDCTEDLAKIRALGLEPEQLLRLGRILAARAPEDTVGCSRARRAMLSIVSMDFSQIDAETLKHVCICPDCRALLYEYREELRQELSAGSESEGDFPCESVTVSDIFCYCLPYEIDPANDEYAGFRESLTSHLRSCPVCLTRMQQLHSCISDIAERPESGVVAAITFDEQPVEEQGSEINDILMGRPSNLREEINQNELVSGAPVATSSRLVSLKRYIRPSLAAAAVLLIAFALFFSAPSAKAVGLEQIYHALEKATNICISRFRAGEEKPWQKQWISSTLNIILYDNDGQYVLWDYDNRQVRIKTKGENIRIESISEDIAAEGKESFNGSFGLLPFSDVTQAKKEAQWNRVDSTNISIDPGVEVYDLTWNKKVTAEITEYNKWRVYVNTTTKLPLRIEWYLKTDSTVNYTIGTIETITYPSDSEIKEFIEITF